MTPVELQPEPDYPPPSSSLDAPHAFWWCVFFVAMGLFCVVAERPTQEQRRRRRRR